MSMDDRFSQVWLKQVSLLLLAYQLALLLLASNSRWRALGLYPRRQPERCEVCSIVAVYPFIHTHTLHGGIHRYLQLIVTNDVECVQNAWEVSEAR
jgi:hypothetical protein